MPNNAALLLHEDGASPEDAKAYAERWLLATETRAKQLVDFVLDPIGRAYITTYTDGVRPLPPTGSRGDPARFKRLLTEQLTPAELASSVAEAYVELCLRLGRHVDGLVDAYYGEPAVKERIDAEPIGEPASLAEDATRLLTVFDVLEEQRRHWLHAQLVGLETVARKLAGEEFAFADEVERCYGVRPRRIDESEPEATHAALDEVLPGTGSLADRYQQWRESQVVPAEKLGAVLGDIVEELRRRTAVLVGLPEGERTSSARFGRAVGRLQLLRGPSSESHRRQHRRPDGDELPH